MRTAVFVSILAVCFASQAESQEADWEPPPTEYKNLQPVYKKIESCQRLVGEGYRKCLLAAIKDCESHFHDQSPDMYYRFQYLAGWKWVALDRLHDPGADAAKIQRDVQIAAAQACDDAKSVHAADSSKNRMDACHRAAYAAYRQAGPEYTMFLKMSDRQRRKVNAPGFFESLNSYFPNTPPTVAPSSTSYPSQPSSRPTASSPPLSADSIPNSRDDEAPKGRSSSSVNGDEGGASQNGNSSSSSTGKGRCQETLGYLSGTIPPVYDNAKLNQIRDQLLATSILTMINSLKAQGKSLQEAARQMMEQAAAHREVMQSNKRCILQAAPNGGEVLVQRLERRDYQGISTSGDVVGACAGTFIAVDWAALANREAALQMACYAH